jgi:chromosome segregation ATPase
MNQEIDARVAELKKRIASAQAARAKAETQAEVALDRVRQAERQLREEFGVAPEDVAGRITALEADLAAEAARAEEALERADGSE